MVNTRLCKMHFSLEACGIFKSYVTPKIQSKRHSHTMTQRVFKTALQKTRDLETNITVKNTCMKLQGPWNLTKMFWDECFLKAHLSSLNTYKYVYSIHPYSDLWLINNKWTLVRFMNQHNFSCPIHYKKIYRSHDA